MQRSATISYMRTLFPLFAVGIIALTVGKNMQDKSQRVDVAVLLPVTPSKVTIGMPRAAVIRAMGQPSGISGNSERQQLFYIDRIVTISKRDDSVIDVSTPARHAVVAAREATGAAAARAEVAAIAAKAEATAIAATANAAAEARSLPPSGDAPRRVWSQPIPGHWVEHDRGVSGMQSIGGS